MNLVVANWKMNPDSIETARKLASQIDRGLVASRKSVETVIAPPFVFIPAVREAIKIAKLGAQDMFFEEKGAYTGQISAKQLLEFRVSHVILGHSEKRKLGEGDELINQKVKAAIKAGIHPILCVGFGAKKQSSISTIKQILKKQLSTGLKDINANNLTIAYEPVWAISKGFGTGQTATPKHAALILEYVSKLVPRARLIYGGSLDGDSSRKFAEKKIIQGGLVGGASLVVEEFAAIIKAFSNKA